MIAHMMSVMRGLTGDAALAHVTARAAAGFAGFIGSCASRRRGWRRIWRS